MNVRNRWLLVGGLLLAVAALPVAWYLLSPLFINVTVEEALPTDVPAPAITVVPAQATEAMMTAAAEPTHAMSEPMPGEGAARTVESRGEFYDVVHDGRGIATIYRRADGSRFLRLEDFNVLNGPELHVYLVSIDPVPYSLGTDIPGSADLGLLKGNMGNQNYDIPSSLDLSGYKSVVIWCRPFRVPFIAAPLAVP